ncbi:MAG TPA: hypothetical protein DDZ51_03860 [Planctomycetaceae bacterium]|nr:hypothetical protein [Planctomycetaceae bacterium]
MIDRDDIVPERVAESNGIDATEHLNGSEHARVDSGSADIDETCDGGSGPVVSALVDATLDIAATTDQRMDGNTSGVQMDVTATLDSAPGSVPTSDRGENVDQTVDSAQPAVVRSGKAASGQRSASQGGSRFQTIKAHARGGLGEVFVARDLELGRTVALKEIQARHSKNRFNQDRFVAEAVITGALEHPGIVPVYGLGRYSDGRPYYAMRFIAGTSFQAAINQYHADNPDGVGVDYYSRDFKSLLRTFVDVCRAIHYAHEHGVLHRDIKPDNVMLGQYGETMVVDWGLAKVLASQGTGESAGHDNPLLQSIATETMGGAVMGTPAYMSPEQAMGLNDKLDATSDIYSLGATLFTLLSGQRSVEGRSSLEVIENVRSGRLRSLRVIAPKVPRALVSICSKSLSVDPIERYADVGAMIEDIERWLADDLVLAHRDRESIAERLGRWVRRHHTWVVSGGMFLIAFLVVAVAAGALINTARKRELVAKQQAEVAKAEAMQRYRQSRQAIDTWLVGSNEALQFFPGTQSIRTRMLELAADDYRQLATSSSRDPDLELERARALIRLGDIHQIQLMQAEARSRYDDAIKVLEKLESQPQIGHLASAEAANANVRKAISYTNENRWADAQAELEPAIAALGALAERYPQEPIMDSYLSAALVNLGETLLSLGKLDAAIEALESVIARSDQAITSAQKSRGDAAGETIAEDWDASLAKFERDAVLAGVRARELLGRGCLARGDYQRADAVLAEAIDRLSRAMATRADDPDWVDALASACVSRANVQRTAGMQKEMEQTLALAVEHYEKLVIALPDVPRYAESLALTLADLGIAMFDDERLDEARAMLGQASSRWQELLRAYPDIARYHEQNAVCEDALSQIVLQREGDGDRAFGHASAAVQTFQELAELFPDAVDHRHRLAISRSHAALAVVKVGQAEASGGVLPQDAKLLFDVAIQGLRSLVEEFPAIAEYRYSLAHVMYREGLELATAGEPELATERLSEAETYWRDLAINGHVEAADHLALLLLAHPQADLRDYQQSLEFAQRATKASPHNLRYRSTLAAAMALCGDVSGAKAKLGEGRIAGDQRVGRDDFVAAICSVLARDADSESVRDQAVTWLAERHPGSPRLQAFERLLKDLVAAENR